MITTLILVVLVAILVLLAAFFVAVGRAFDKVEASIAELTEGGSGELVDTDGTVWTPSGVDDAGRTLYTAEDGLFSGWRREDIDRMYGIKETS